MRDLFGEAPEQSKPVGKGLGPQGGKHYVMPKGYAAMPGTGPAGETCGSCQHHATRQMGKVYHKCYLVRGRWSRGRGTDILVRSPACSRWLAIEAQPNEGRS